MSKKLVHTSKKDSNNIPKSALLAVSGGVDSIVLLDLISKFYRRNNQENQQLLKIENKIINFLDDNPIKKLEAIYIDHSQREDTDQDILHIKDLTEKYKLPLNLIKLSVDKDSSENTLRELRYKNFNKVLETNNLDHIVTAHHADDVLETALINIKRGTSPKGLTSLKHHTLGVWRPYLYKDLDITKQDILNYAKKYKLTWHEDSTNHNTKYLRNQIREDLKSIHEQKKKKIISILEKNQTDTKKLSELTKKLITNLNVNKDTYSRTVYLNIKDQKVRYEILHNILSKYGYEISKEAVVRSDQFLKEKDPKKVLQLRGCSLIIHSKEEFKISSTGKKSAIIST
ncbi:MAG TPA: tRNA lysidine(34) synthetase TilS [Candidatus Saccharimonadales bacterium]|nr:tRNA lysidine(34) synthetase TilS [Candidatus Saccharimonadales bacterium]